MNDVSALRKYLRSQGFHTYRGGGSRRTAEVIWITTGAGQRVMLLYVKRADEEYPPSGYWWGVNDNQISSLNARSQPWWLVLLFGKGEGKDPPV